jgi:hypothetical protein
MKNEFTTFDIMKALEIPRERLREWINRGFVKPHQSADGQGTKAIFTRSDVYAVALFKRFIEHGITRKAAAAELSRIISQGGLNNNGRLIIKKEKRGTGEFIVSAFLDQNRQTLPGGREDLIIINFGQLKKDIDSREI